MELLEQYTVTKEALQVLRADIMDRIEDSVASEEALKTLLNESQTIYELLEQWGERLEAELDEWNIEKMARDAVKRTRRKREGRLRAAPECSECEQRHDPSESCGEHAANEAEWRKDTNGS